MGSLMAIGSNYRPPSPESRLMGIIDQLTDLEADMLRADLREQAGSLRTVITDLSWQSQAMDVECGTD